MAYSLYGSPSCRVRRATIKALPSHVIHPRPYGLGISPGCPNEAIHSVLDVVHRLQCACLMLLRQFLNGGCGEYDLCHFINLLPYPT
jgi:hypothetical protein